MSSERADVLIIGAGASGGVVGRRLAEAGFKVVCLEQGQWPDRADGLDDDPSGGPLAGAPGRLRFGARAGQFAPS